MRSSNRGKCGRRVRQPEEIPNRIRGPDLPSFVRVATRRSVNAFDPDVKFSPSFFFTFFPIAFRAFELIARKLRNVIYTEKMNRVIINNLTNLTRSLLSVIRLSFLRDPNPTAGTQNVNGATSRNSLFIGFDSLQRKNYLVLKRKKQ